MKILNIEDLQTIEIKEEGKYLMIREDYYKRLISLCSHQNMFVAEDGTISLGKIIKNYRERASLKQSELAMKIEITKAQMCNIEKGNILKPRRSTLLKLCLVLGPVFQETLVDLGYIKEQAS